MSAEMYSKAYIARCHRTLKEWGAPLDGWLVFNTYDCLEEADELFTCELCGCTQVRIVHEMKHTHFYEPISVGCICAGIMEGDILAAKERDRLMKNRAKRRKNFLKQTWEEPRYGVFLLLYRGELLKIFRSRTDPNRFEVCCGYTSIECHKGKPITDFLSAVHAAFNLIDPAEEAWHA
jgi:hypothetical protein